MNYKIVSKNENLLNKSHHIFNILGYKEAIHIQDVNFWLIDAKSMDENSITSYLNRKDYAFLLFVINSPKEIALCLKNGFTNYIDIEFSKEELLSWCKLFESSQKEQTIFLEDNYFYELQTNSLKHKDLKIDLTKKETLLLKELLKGEFISTLHLANTLKVNTTTSVRTVINRIRKKTNENFITQKRGFGYKLSLKKEKSETKVQLDSYVKEIEEQNHLMQQIIDSSPIFIVTFIHKQLYCINESFREFLGKEIIKELWDETQGDFFQLIKQGKKIKEELFIKGTHQVEFYELTEKQNNSFEVETFYFENLDKHLLIFKPQS